MARAAKDLWTLPAPAPRPEPRTLGERIRYVREEVKHWSQGRLADEVSGLGRKMSRSTLNTIENGGHRPSFGQVLLIAKALDVSLGALGVTSKDYPELRALRAEDASRLLAMPSKRTGQARHLTAHDGQGKPTSPVRGIQSPLLVPQP